METSAPRGKAGFLVLKQRLSSQRAQGAERGGSRRLHVESPGGGQVLKDTAAPQRKGGLSCSKKACRSSRGLSPHVVGVGEGHDLLGDGRGGEGTGRSDLQDEGSEKGGGRAVGGRGKCSDLREDETVRPLPLAVDPVENGRVHRFRH